MTPTLWKWGVYIAATVAFIAALAVWLSAPEPTQTARSEAELKFLKNGASPQPVPTSLKTSAESKTATAFNGSGAAALRADYGQTVISAIASNSPEEAGKAFVILEGCQSAVKLLDSLEKLRSGSEVGNEKLGRAVGVAAGEVQRCQSVTPEMMLNLKTLGERALRGGIRGVAVRYGYLTNFQPNDELRSPLLAGLIVDANEGDMNAAIQLGLSGDKLGLPQIERCAYLLYADRALSGPQRELLRMSAQQGCQYSNDEERKTIESLASKIPGGRQGE